MKHYRFRTRLDERCKLEKGTNLIICSEEYTSKTCTRCGLLTDVGSSEVYRCSSCNLVIDRDINGCKNIFKIFKYALAGKERPKAYCRPKILPKKKTRKTVKVGIIAK